MPRGRYQQKQWEDRQAAILDALERLATERGFAAVTMDDVADAVGISKATLYQHFESKDAMLVELMAQHEDQFIAWVEQTAGQRPVERLLHMMRHLMEGHISPLRGLVSLGREDVLPIFNRTEALVSRHDQIIALFTGIIQQGQADGSIASDLVPHEIIGAMLALSNISMGQYEPPECNRELNARTGHADQMLLLFARSLRP
jgi:TetR/AcrR family transcriptional regulator, regulator of autoinduction and epiphytic fitness